MFLSNEKYYEHRNATVRYICHEVFTKEKCKVRDHNHLTGDYRGPAHLKCNFKIRNPNFIPVFMPNLSNYDSHVFIKELGKEWYSKRNTRNGSKTHKFHTDHQSLGVYR
jgi:hypothetical protein